jgi:hypothetical protein
VKRTIIFTAAMLSAMPAFAFADRPDFDAQFQALLPKATMEAPTQPTSMLIDRLGRAYSNGERSRSDLRSRQRRSDARPAEPTRISATGFWFAYFSKHASQWKGVHLKRDIRSSLRVTSRV